jgi:hypothetical protein
MLQQRSALAVLNFLVWSCQHCHLDDVEVVVDAAVFVDSLTAILVRNFRSMRNQNFRSLLSEQFAWLILLYVKTGTDPRVMSVVAAVAVVVVVVVRFDDVAVVEMATAIQSHHRQWQPNIVVLKHCYFPYA